MWLQTSQHRFLLAGGLLLGADEDVVGALEEGVGHAAEVLLDHVGLEAVLEVGQVVARQVDVVEGEEDGPHGALEPGVLVEPLNPRLLSPPL